MSKYQKQIITEEEFKRRILNEKTMNAREEMALIIDGARSGCKSAYELLAKYAAHAGDDNAEMFWAQEGAVAGSTYCMLVCGVKGASSSTRVYWLKKAYAAGSKEAAYHLANCYLNGIGVPQKPVKAKKLFSEATSAGIDKAKWAFAYTNNLCATAEYADAYNAMDTAPEDGKNDSQSRFSVSAGAALSEAIDLGFAEHIESFFQNGEAFVASDISRMFDTEEHLPDEKEMYRVEENRLTSETCQKLIKKHKILLAIGIVLLIFAVLLYFVIRGSNPVTSLIVYVFAFIPMFFSVRMGTGAWKFPTLSDVGSLLSGDMGDAPFMVLIVLEAVIAVAFIAVSFLYPSSTRLYILPVKTRNKLEKRIHQQYLNSVNAERARASKAATDATNYELQMPREIEALKQETMALANEITSSASVLKKKAPDILNLYLEIGFFTPQATEQELVAELQNIRAEIEAESVFRPLAAPDDCDIKTPAPRWKSAIKKMDAQNNYATVLESFIYMLFANKSSVVANLDFLGNRVQLNGISEIIGALRGNKKNEDILPVYAAAMEKYIEDAANIGSRSAVSILVNQAFNRGDYNVCLQYVNQMKKDPEYFAEQLYMLADEDAVPIAFETREELAKLAAETGHSKAIMLSDVYEIVRGKLRLKALEEEIARKAEIAQIRREQQEAFQAHEREQERAEADRKERLANLNMFQNIMERLNDDGNTVEDRYHQGYIDKYDYNDYKQRRDNYLKEMADWGF